MARVTFVKKAQKAIPSAGIKKGDSYYWWKFRFGGKYVSKTQPKKSQLTQSGFLSQLYDLQDRIAEFSTDCKDDFESFRDEVASEIDSLRDEAQSSLDNMPEHLQESSSSGQMLTERIEALENWQSEIESVEVESDEEEIRERLKDELVKEEGESDEDFKARIDTEVENEYQEVLDTAVNELQNTDCGL